MFVFRGVSLCLFLDTVHQFFNEVGTTYMPTMPSPCTANGQLLLMEEIRLTGWPNMVIKYPLIYRVLAPSQVVFSPDFWLPSTVLLDFFYADLESVRKLRGAIYQGRTLTEITGELDQIQGSWWITNPNKQHEWFLVNPSKLPSICCLFDPTPPNRSHLMTPYYTPWN